MKFIKGNDRTQTHLFPVSLDQSIDQDNEVRLIDLFVESLEMGSYGFKSEFKQRLIGLKDIPPGLACNAR